MNTVGRAVAVWSFASLLSVSSSARAAPQLSHLTPGADLRIQQTIDVNIVTVGFSGVTIPPGALAQLPGFNGVPRAGADGKVFLAERFDFRYHLIQAPSWFEDALFGTLRAAAFPQPPLPVIAGLPPIPITPAQALYDFCNVDPSVDPAHGCNFSPFVPRVNHRFVTQNYIIDASYVEKLLSHSLGSALGVDVTRPTIVLMNWYGRPDYVDHIYLDPSEPDPETHVPRGFFLVNEFAGYGGTSYQDPETCAAGDCLFHRMWFFDVSAGPMAANGSFDLVAPVPRFIGARDLGGPDYRIHHIADYAPATPGTYRPINTLLGDLGKLIGDVFLSGIAYAGPIYPPGLTPPRQPHHLVLDINRWTWDPGRTFAGLLDVPRMLSKMNRLPYDFAVSITDRNDPPDSPLGRVWDCSLTSLWPTALGQSCYGNRYGGYAFADLLGYFTDHLFQFLTGAPDYEVPIFQFLVPPALAHAFAGVADSNYAGLTSLDIIATLQQTYVYTSTTAQHDSFSGHGALLEHEVGHHLGFSHPFNGYRCTTEQCAPVIPYGLGETFFSLDGRYVTGLMTYAAVNNDYSQFELDNLRRYLTYEYLDLSNFFAAKIIDSPRAGAVDASLVQADGLAGGALAAYQASAYDVAVENARAAYSTLVAAADAIHVHVSADDWHALRRNPADTNQQLRDLVKQVFDPAAAMSGGLSLAGVPGLEGLTAAPPTTPLATRLNTPTVLTLTH